MRYALLAAILLILSSNFARAIDRIPDVKSLADLRKLPVVHIADGWDVQVGMADPGDDAGPYRLIYCLADRKGPETDIEHKTERNLGPLFVELTGRPTLPQPVRNVADVKFGASLPRLSCQSIAIGWLDDQTVKVWAGETALYQREFEKAEHRRCYWSEFATTPPGLSKEGDFVVSGEPMVKCPQFSEFDNLLVSRAKDVKDKLVPPENATLPGGIVLSAEWQKFYFPSVIKPDVLDLSLKDDCFVIRSNGIRLDTPPTLHLLARWWVNDKPIANDPGRRQKTAMLYKTLSTDAVKLRVGVPKFLGSLKTGDRVSLQLLYTPKMQDVPGGMRQLDILKQLENFRSDKVEVPIQSNRLDFTVDEHLLSLIDKQATK